MNCHRLRRVASVAASLTASVAACLFLLTGCAARDPNGYSFAAQNIRAGAKLYEADPKSPDKKVAVGHILDENESVVGVKVRGETIYYDRGTFAEEKKFFVLNSDPALTATPKP